MNVQISYPVPLRSEENFSEFAESIDQFCESWRKNPPGIQCTLYAVCMGNYPDSQVIDFFDRLPVQFVYYSGEGYDIGAAQHLAKTIGANRDFQISMPTRVRFQHEGWGKWIVGARTQRGRGLYATSASREGRFHFRTACYGMDLEDWRAYPMTIDSKDKCYWFESGHENQTSIYDWMVDRNLAAWIIYWHAELSLPNLILEAENIFRKGDQSNLLVLDKHCDLYSSASPEEKKRLERLSEGVKDDLSDHV